MNKRIHEIVGDTNGLDWRLAGFDSEADERIELGFFNTKKDAVKSAQDFYKKGFAAIYVQDVTTGKTTPVAMKGKKTSMENQNNTTDSTTTGNQVSTNQTSEQKEVSPMSTTEVTVKEGNVTIAHADKKAHAKDGDQKQATKPEDKKDDFKLLPPDNTVLVSLTQLVPLDTTPIENAEIAMREINEQHLSHLQAAIEAGKALPALKVVRSTKGYVVIDGYHRWGAYEKHLSDAAKEKTKIETEIDALYEVARRNYKVRIQQVAVQSDFDLLSQAFSANLEHGLPASDPSRSRYALFLVQQSRNAFPDDKTKHLSIRAAAKIALVSHTAVNKMAKKIRNKNKMIDAALTEVGEVDTTVPETPEEKKARQRDEKTGKAVQDIIKAVKFLSSVEMAAPDLDELLKNYAHELNQTDIDAVFPLLNRIRNSAKPAPTPTPATTTQATLPTAK